MSPPPPQNLAQDLFNVRGLVAVITGGGTGLGLYAARALDANGAKAVYIIGRRKEILEKAASTAINGRIFPLVGDVTDKKSLEEVADRVRKEQGGKGGIDFLFANAGVQGPMTRDYLPPRKKGEGEKEERKGKPPTLKEMQEALWAPDMMDDFTRAYHVNCTGTFYTVVAFLDLLGEAAAANLKKGKGKGGDPQVVITSSVAALSRNMASGFAYSASKAAVHHVSKMISTLFAQNGYRIRCNTIIPGIYPSEMTEGSMASLEKFEGPGGGDEEDGGFTDATVMDAQTVPAERSGSEEDFAGTILYLASRAGAYVNGECLLTDGGRLAQLPATY